jgi:hypothetical protein
MSKNSLQTFAFDRYYRHRDFSCRFRLRACDRAGTQRWDWLLDPFVTVCDEGRDNDARIQPLLWLRAARPRRDALSFQHRRLDQPWRRLPCRTEIARLQRVQPDDSSRRTGAASVEELQTSHLGSPVAKHRLVSSEEGHPVASRRRRVKPFRLRIESVPNRSQRSRWRHPNWPESMKQPCRVRICVAGLILHMHSCTVSTLRATQAQATIVASRGGLEGAGFPDAVLRPRPLGAAIDDERRRRCPREFRQSNEPLGVQGITTRSAIALILDPFANSDRAMAGRCPRAGYLSSRRLTALRRPSNLGPRTEFGRRRSDCLPAHGTVR